MATAELNARRETILDALTAEIHRQALTDLDEIDLVALAAAVDRALGDDSAPSAVPLDDDGKTPDELNAANDG